jgi:hypothetical protein
MSEATFLDYYEDLQISPNADKETIERVYRLLAKRYHPDNKQAGNSEKFDLITKAYHTLSIPEKRAAYDVKYEDEKTRRWKALSGASAPQSFKNDRCLRLAILSILYIERRNDPSNSAIGIWRLEQLLGWPEKMLEFHIWYLKEKGWIQRTDTGGYAITAEGIDIIEEDDLIVDKNRLLPDHRKAPVDEERDKEALKAKKSGLNLIGEKV